MAFLSAGDSSSLAMALAAASGSPTGVSMPVMPSWTMSLVPPAAVGTRDIVQEGITGMLTPVGDPEAAARAIARLLLSPAERKAMGAAGRNTVLRRFSQEAMVERTGQLYLD